MLVKPFENVTLYANYIEGLKAPEVVSGATTFFNVGTILPFVQTKQKEAGVKVDMGRITTTVSAFEITDGNPVSLPSPDPDMVIRQIDGEQVNRGVEVYVFGEVTPEVRLLGGVTFIDGKVVKGTAGTTDVNVDGKVPVGVSKVNVNFGGEWDTPFIAI